MKTVRDGNSVSFPRLAVALLILMGLAWAQCGRNSEGSPSATGLEDQRRTVEIKDAADPEMPDTTVPPDRTKFDVDANRPDLPEWDDLLDVQPRFESLLGEPCPENGECIHPSGWLMCLKVDDFPPFCATTDCVQGGDCPEDWECMMNPNWEPPNRIQFICLPTPHELCEPCVVDSDCLATSGRCVEMGDEGNSFCTAACKDDGVCPDDYICKYVTGVDPQPVEQCVPLSWGCDGRSPDGS